MRFDQLLKVVNSLKFSILDYGCGYGTLVDYLMEKGYEVEYYGYDILAKSIALARQLYGGKPRQKFFSEKVRLVEADYVVESGVFNV